MRSEPGANWSDRTGFWLSLAGVCAALGGAAAAIAVGEYHPPWGSAWFITGGTLGALGCGCAIRALVIRLTRKVAQRRELHLPAGGPGDGISDIEIPALAPSGTTQGEQPGTQVRRVLREISADLRQVARAIAEAQADNSYAQVEEAFNLVERWEGYLPVLARLANGDPYNKVRDARGHIDRIKRTVCGSPTKPAASRPHPSHDLETALEAVRGAGEAVNDELRDLGPAEK